MISFVVSVIALIIGYFIYGKFVEKVFGPDSESLTPAKRLEDGVDYVEMDIKKTFLIQFLNIAGTGPIFGAVAGAMWGPAAFIWIVFGCIFAGAVHDYLIGMMSLRRDGASVAELVGENLGNGAKQLMRVFSVVLLVLVGVVFVTSPAAILNDLTGIDKLILIGIIIIYYLIATVLPIDKVIGKIYPIFGVALLIMAVGIGFGIIIQGYDIPELALRNYHPKGQSVFPYLCISIACGAISGFHATQSPMMARCLGNENQGRKVFYGAMIAEGIVALIWAAAAMSFFGGTEGLGVALSKGGAAVVVNKISGTVLGKVGGALALLGVVACPITSGDTAFRSARLTIADAINYKQGPIINRFVVAIPLFVIGVALCFIDFNILWRYFSWSNQTLATIALWAGAAYLAKKGKFFWMAAIPATFMTVVVTSYILIAPEGFRMSESIGNTVGLIVAAVSIIAFIKKFLPIYKEAVNK
ncbi:carbon starvation CstA family protein [Fusobacterium perfoetens]|uniref:carbon starvation CstA family protein n=1 Tax=Fusobacterium perfoetens TaxID=852 RepID=UPI000487465C|nr:carbon starvation CstA family protein [Fusobacterium perfoetens]MCI6151945.1 carbon starvation protein A [Fusobacterium perfoetens]MDY3238285.1 carbon starvation CstA family protein [Fusobacterium perfoetens]